MFVVLIILDTKWHSAVWTVVKFINCHYLSGLLLKIEHACGRNTDVFEFGVKINTSKKEGSNFWRVCLFICSHVSSKMSRLSSGEYIKKVGDYFIVGYTFCNYMGIVAGDSPSALEIALYLSCYYMYTHWELFRDDAIPFRFVYHMLTV